MDSHQPGAALDVHSLLQPAVFKENMVKALLFIATFEILKGSVTNHVKSFFTMGLDELTEYKRCVLALDPNKNPLKASLLWLRDSEAITDEDITSFYALRETRNQLTHDFPRMEHFGRSLQITEGLTRMLALLNKIEAWWFWEVENTIKPLKEQAQPEDEVYSGTQLFTNLIVEMALESH